MAKSSFAKAKSGISGFDEICGGGLNRGSICTVLGPTGSGRTTFALQFLVHGIEEEGENGLLLSFDEQKATFFANALSFGWDLAGLEREKKFVFIEYPHNELEHFIDQEGAIRDLIDALGIKRVVIDSITPFAVLFPEADERMRSLLRLVQVLRKWNVTIMVTAEDVSTGAGMPKSVSGVESFTDGLVHLLFERAQDGRRVRLVEVLKMRGCAHLHGAVEARITGRGFELLMPQDYGAAQQYGDEPQEAQPEKKAALAQLEGGAAQQAAPKRKKPAKKKAQEEDYQD